MKNEKTIRMTQLAIFVALELVLTFTPIGYLNVPGLSITFLMVPVLLGGILLGPGEGAILGAVFGLTSFAQCFGASPFGAALLGINPLGTFLVCFVPRLLSGLLPALMFRLASQTHAQEKPILLFGGIGLFGSLCNTFLFMSFLVLFFFQTDYLQTMAAGMGTTNPLIFAALFVGVQSLVEAAACAVLTALLCRVLYKVIARPTKQS